jgi:hypothetical protein
MLSRTERIHNFHLRVSHTEKELYEEFLKIEEAALVLEMQQYFAQAKGHAGVPTLRERPVPNRKSER